MCRCAPAQPGENRKPWRGAFALTEPLPYVGVETGMLGGKVRSPSGTRARSRSCRSTSAAASSPTWASPTSSPPPSTPTTRASRAAAWSSSRRPTPAPSIAARPPASWCTSSPRPAIPSSACACPPAASSAATRVKDGVIVPRYSHGEIIEAVFRRTRVTVGLMTSAKLLSAVEPVIRYQRNRFRGGAIAARLAPLRAGPPAQGRCPPPAGGCLGHRRSQRRARIRSRTHIRPTRSARNSEERNPGGARNHRGHRHVQSHAPGAERSPRSPAYRRMALNMAVPPVIPRAARISFF